MPKQASAKTSLDESSIFVNLPLKILEMIQSRLLSLLFLLTITIAAYSQVDTKKLDTYIAQAQTDWEIPGMAVGIIYNGKVMLAKGYGTLEEGKSISVDANSLFAIASNTKAFVATAIGMLVEEGKLKWDDPVKKYLPYFEMYDAYVSSKTTVRDLLCHRAGLGTYSGDVIWYKSDYTAEEVVKHIKEVPQAYDFRGGYGYSNLMFITAGEVIQKVSGLSWADFVQKRILNPLGMSRTQTSVVPLDKMENVATPHKPVKGKNVPIPYTNWDNMGAAGGIISSVSDMLKWIQLQIDGGKSGDQRVFSQETQNQLWKTHNNRLVTKSSKRLYPTRNFNGYGLGWGLSDYGGHLVTSHGGGYDGMYSRVTIVPDAGLGIVILTNSMKGISTPLAYQIMDAYLGLAERDRSQLGLVQAKNAEKRWQNRVKKRTAARKKETKLSLPLKDYVGKYYCPMFGPIEVKMNENQLQLIFPKAPKLNARLSHWHFNTFEINWEQTHAWFDFGTLQFILDNNGQVQELQFDVPNQDIFFEEIQAKRME